MRSPIATRRFPQCSSLSQGEILVRPKPAALRVTGDIVELLE